MMAIIECEAPAGNSVSSGWILPRELRNFKNEHACQGMKCEVPLGSHVWGRRERYIKWPSFHFILVVPSISISLDLFFSLSICQSVHVPIHLNHTKCLDIMPQITSCLGLQEEPKRSYPLFIKWASHHAHIMLILYSINMSACLPTCLPALLPTNPSIHPSIHPSIQMIYLS